MLLFHSFLLLIYYTALLLNLHLFLFHPYFAVFHFNYFYTFFCKFQFLLLKSHGWNLLSDSSSQNFFLPSLIYVLLIVYILGPELIPFWSAVTSLCWLASNYEKLDSWYYSKQLSIITLQRSLVCKTNRLYQNNQHFKTEAPIW